VGVQARFRQLTPGETVSYSHFTGEQGGLKTSLDASEERETFSLGRETGHCSTVTNPYPSHYTDWAVQAVRYISFKSQTLCRTLSIVYTVKKNQNASEVFWNVIFLTMLTMEKVLQSVCDLSDVKPLSGADTLQVYGV
jgi:hypothetical protein